MIRGNTLEGALCEVRVGTRGEERFNRASRRTAAIWDVSQHTAARCIGAAHNKPMCIRRGLTRRTIPRSFY